ncbi:MAG TPA: hypothetical protein VHZ24_22235 [Pirellulales bacterium]|nr:hypothetical protein [Pirellulales bacterium]
MVANVEFETWFVAAAESLTDYLDVVASDPPSNPEGDRCGNGWVASRFKGIKYSEAIDQPSLTAKMDLPTCKARSPSFDKLCRELRARSKG